MKKLPVTLLALATLFVVYMLGVSEGTAIGGKTYKDTIEQRDTVFDTIIFRQPIPVDSLVLHHKTVKFQITDTALRYVDSLRIDSIQVDVPIVQKEYIDSLYHAWVSGYDVNLDSIKVKNRTITVTQQIIQSPQRWGLGIQLGIGYEGHESKIRPFIGLGISYNFLTW